MVYFPFPTVRKRRGKQCSYGKVPRLKTSPDQKEHKIKFVKKHLDNPQDFCENIIDRLDKKWNFLEDVFRIMHSTAFYKRTSYEYSNMVAL